MAPNPPPLPRSPRGSSYRVWLLLVETDDGVDEEIWRTSTLAAARRSELRRSDPTVRCSILPRYVRDETWLKPTGDPR